MVALAVAAAVFACDDDGGELSSAPEPDARDAGRDVSVEREGPGTPGPRILVRPAGGRPAAVTCSLARPDGGVTASVDGGACASDEDCDAGPDGRCNPRRLGETVPACSYQACAVDSDCAASMTVCGCGAGWAGQNVCLSNSNCRIDADCPTGERCVYSNPPILRYDDSVATGDEVAGPHYTGDAIGYFCTTPADACDCPHDLSTNICIFNVVEKHWGCAYQP